MTSRMQRSVEPGEGVVLPQITDHKTTENKRLLGESSKKGRNNRKLSVGIKDNNLDVEDKLLDKNLVDYTVHPLVLGPSYLFEDFQSRSVNLLDTKSSGVTVVGINKGIHFASRLRAAKLLNTFQVKTIWTILNKAQKHVFQ